jgi:hypothetical protein
MNRKHCLRCPVGATWTSRDLSELLEGLSLSPTPPQFGSAVSCAAGGGDILIQPRNKTDSDRCLGRMTEQDNREYGVRLGGKRWFGIRLSVRVDGKVIKMYIYSYMPTPIS